MKLRITRTIKLIALLLPAVMLLALLPYTSAMETTRIRNFYKEGEDTLDVVLMGASEVFADFAPGLAYGEYGFTSYDYAISQNYLGIFKPQMEEVLRTQSPEVIVVDINSAMFVGRNSSQDATFRTFIEGTPLSLNKIKSIREFPYREQPLSYYLPFIMYHGNMSLRDLYVLWSNEKCFWENDGALLKGALTSLDNSTWGERLEIPGREETMPMPEEYEQEFHKFLQYCQSVKDTKILFVTFPHRITNEMGYNRLLQTNWAEDIIESYGFDYINMEYLLDDIGLDMEKDFYNDEHLNVHGQRKFTRYLSRILVEDYGVTARPQTEENIQRWEQSIKYTKLFYAYYEKLKQDNPVSDLMMNEASWLISELNWMEGKLQEDGLPLTFESVYGN